MSSWKVLRRCGVVALILAGLTNAAESQTSQAISPKPPDAARQAQSRIFTHPKYGYTLAVPPGDEVLEREDDNSQISIRSRKGYKISVQAGASRHQIPLNQLPGLIEKKYFGPGKPWNQRLDDHVLQVAGLDAYLVNYEGANNRSQVIFVRGQKLDYVFIFIAALREFPRYIHEFEWLLNNFVPAQGESVPKSEQFQTRAGKFIRPELGYSMLYPTDWVQSEPATTTMMFSGRPGTPTYTSIVSVENIKPPGAANSNDVLSLAVADLKTNLSRSVRGVQFTVDQPWSYIYDGIQLQGRELSAIYSHSGQKFRKVIFVIPRPLQPLAHVWSYTAPEKDFQTFYPLAEQMLKSWRILGVNRG